MTAPTLSTVLRPASRGLTLLYDAATVAVSSIAIALSGQIAIPLWFTPVPVTLQTLAVLLVGASLGWRKGSLAVILFLAEGAAGLPVFSAWGSGIAHLVGPTGGYLTGFLVAAALTGFLAERGWDRTPARAALAMFFGNVAIYLVGLSWLAAFVGLERAPALGLYPFVVGDCLKIAVATGALPLAWRILSRTTAGRSPSP